MRVTKDCYMNFDWGQIPINEEWNMPAERESRMHSIHAYPAKFPAFITTKAIKHAEELNIPVHCVADIFCGCGTVAYETVRNGKKFWGCDINPVATLIAEVKSQSYQEEFIVEYYERIKVYLSQHVIPAPIPQMQNERIQYWFHPNQITDLARLLEAIQSVVDDEKYRKFFLCAFSNILKSCSKWLTKSIKPQVDPRKTEKNPLLAFDFQVQMMRKANQQNRISGDANVDIVTDNFLNHRVEHPFVDLVVTSPPYVTSYEYADLHQLSTLWLGYAEDYRDFRKGTIGSLHYTFGKEEGFDTLNEVGRKLVDEVYQQDCSKARAIARYYNDMQQVVDNLYLMLNKGGACLFVIGNTEYKGVKIDNARHLVETLFEQGFTEVDVDRRKISNKILTPYRDKKGKFSSDKSSRKIYSDEFIIFARKL